MDNMYAISLFIPLLLCFPTKNMCPARIGTLVFICIHCSILMPGTVPGTREASKHL